MAKLQMCNFMMRLSTFLLLSWAILCSAQRSPNPDLQAAKFNYNVSFRQNVCDLRGQELKYALRGLNLTSVFIPSEYFDFDFDTGSLNPVYEGILPLLMDEISERGEFHWRNSFAVISDHLDDGKTFTDFLNWTTKTYDISPDWWTFDINRISQGIIFPEGWYDSSIIMVAKVAVEEPVFSIFSWTDPFSWQVWLLTIATIIFSGVIYYFLEVIDPHSDAQELEESCIENIFLSAINFTTHFMFQPRTNASRLFTFSLSFWGMLMGAAYTANLASFLVLDQSTQTTQVTKLSEAVDLNYRMCVLRGGAVNDTIHRNFGNKYLDVLGYDTTEEKFIALGRDECDIAVTEAYSWEYWEQQNSANSGCNLAAIGNVHKFIPAGFALRSDSGNLCTSLIADVINIWMHVLIEEGFIHSAWQDHLDRTSTQDCSSQEMGENMQVTTNTLTLRNMGGIFIFHAFLSVLSLFFALFYKHFEWDKVPRFAKSGPSSRRSVRKTLEEISKQETLSKQETKLLKASRRKSVMELVEKAKSRTEILPTQKNPPFRQIVKEGVAEDNEESNHLDNPSPFIRNEQDLSLYLSVPKKRIVRFSSMRNNSESSQGAGVADELARLSFTQDEQIEATIEMRDQISELTKIIKEKFQD